jgi:hypothetical protein
MYPGGTRGRRGQTGLDYLVGIGVFLLTVGFVLAFVPGTLTPFTASAAQPMVADRAADTLVAGLADGPEPNVLDTTCTLAFFGVGSDPGCAFASGATADELGLPEFTRVNVTLERSVAGTAVRDVRYTTGPSVPTTEPVVTATRAVYVDGQDAVLVVRVW